MPAPAESRIDQTVHGYERGHRELAGSFELDDEARATMLVMSDLLVDQALDGQNSYLSCYPLRSAARHVLARTWSAGPLFRPGSVWTHSLLVPYQALAQISDLAGLLPYLQRPDGRLDRYDKPVFVDPEARGPTLPLDRDAARIALTGIYGFPPARRVRAPNADSVQNEGLALSLWRQAWPGLRRDFAFITGIAERAAAQDAGCVLRFTTEPLSPAKREDGFDLLLKDLEEPGPTSLRQFLSRYAVESTEPRGIASELATIWAEGAPGGSGRKIAALADLSRLHRLPRLRRDMIASELASLGNEANLLDLVAKFGDEPIAGLPEAVGDKIGHLSLGELRCILSIGLSSPTDGLASMLAERIVGDLDLQSLSSIAEQGNRSLLIAARPELAFVPMFWPSSDAERADLIRSLASGIRFTVDDAFKLFGSVVGRDAAQALVHRSAAKDPLSALALLKHGTAEIRQAAANVIAGNDEIAEIAFASLSEGDLPALESIAAARIASTARLAFSKPWIAAAERVTSGGQSLISSGALGALLLTCACRLGGTSGLQVAVTVYEPLYTALRNYRLGRDEESWLERELPSTPQAYSLRSRLAAAVVITWPPHDGDAGCLLLCQDLENARELVNQVNDRFDRSTLRAAAKVSALPSAAVDAIEAKLHSPRSKFGWFGF